MTKKLYTMADLRAVCRKKHIELDINTYPDYAIYSSKGYRFASGAHVYRSTHHGEKAWKLEAVQDLMAEIKEGFVKCPRNCSCKE